MSIKATALQCRPAAKVKENKDRESKLSKSVCVWGKKNKNKNKKSSGDGNDIGGVTRRCLCQVSSPFVRRDGSE